MSDSYTQPVEGIDYYVEGGRWVFTAAYHLKRGYCCQSGCRHCPFGSSPADRAAVVGDALRSARPDRDKTEQTRDHLGCSSGPHSD